MPHLDGSQANPGPVGALVSVGSGLLAFSAADVQTLLVGMTGVIGGLGAAGFQYYKYWVDQRKLAEKAAEALARADRAEKAAEAAKEELKQYMREQIDEYRQYRHDGPDADINRELLAHRAQIKDNTLAVNINTPVLEQVAKKVGIPARVADPVESIVDDLPKSRD